MIQKKEQKLFTNLIILYFIFHGGFILHAQNVIPVWSNLIPNSILNNDYREVFTYDEDHEVRGISKVINPTLTIYLADEHKSNGAAVIICPGGGYSHLSINKEGYKVASWLNAIGVSAFVLKYRLPNDLIMKDKSIGPLQDAQEAIRLVRGNSEKWKLDPNKIGVMGFSAGGHLASTLSTQYHEKVYNSDTINARPDFSILIYPVISMNGDITNIGSKVNLLGENVSTKLIDKYSNEKQVNANTPPAFLIHAMDDKVVPVENSINYILALKEHQVSAELHIYEEGGHGFGLGREGADHPWPDALKKWLVNHDFVKE